MGATMVSQVKESTTHPSTAKSNFGVHNLKGVYEQEFGILNPLEEREFERLFREIEESEENLAAEKWIKEAIFKVKSTDNVPHPFMAFELALKERMKNNRKEDKVSYIQNTQEQEIIDYFIETNELESISKEAIEIVLEMTRKHGVVKTVKHIGELNKPLDISYYKAIELRDLSERNIEVNPLHKPLVYTDDLKDRIEDEKHSTLEPESYIRSYDNKEETPNHEAGLVQTEMELEADREQSTSSPQTKEMSMTTPTIHHKMRTFKTQTMNEYEAQIAEYILENQPSPMRPKELIQELKKFGIRIPDKSITSRLYTYMKYSKIVRLGVGKYTVSKEKTV